MFKAFTGSLELKDADSGEFKATFSRLQVTDRDGDVTAVGAFTEGQPVRIASFGHKWTELPVGLGTIHADHQKAWVDGQFFLDTTPGRDTYTTVKRLGALQEWSYGFEILDSTFGQHEGKDVRFLRKLNVFEVSPVLLGAGIGTQTDSIKQSLGDQSDRLVADLEALVATTTALLAGLPPDGDLTDTKRRKLAHLLETFSSVAAVRADLERALATVKQSPEPEPTTVDHAGLAAEWLHMHARLTGQLEYAR